MRLSFNQIEAMDKTHTHTEFRGQPAEFLLSQGILASTDFNANEGLNMDARSSF